MMGFHHARHLPRRIRDATDLAQDYARTVTSDSELKTFLKEELPSELALHRPAGGAVRDSPGQPTCARVPPCPGQSGRSCWRPQERRLLGAQTR